MNLYEDQVDVQNSKSWYLSFKNLANKNPRRFKELLTKIERLEPSQQIGLAGASGHPPLIYKMAVKHGDQPVFRQAILDLVQIEKELGIQFDSRFANWLVDYATRIIRGRWPAASEIEGYIAKDPTAAEKYYNLIKLMGDQSAAESFIQIAQRGLEKQSRAQTQTSTKTVSSAATQTHVSNN